MKREIIEGQSFGEWEVISYAGCRGNKKTYYNCRCRGCGEIYQVRKDKMKSRREHQVFSVQQKKSKDRPMVRLCKRADDPSVMISRENWRVRLDLIRRFFIFKVLRINLCE